MARVPYNKLLTNLASSSSAGEYWPSVEGIIIPLSTRAVIGQFNGSYSPVRSAKFKVGFVAKLFRDLSPSVLTFYGK